MNKKEALGGQSLFFNALFIILNLTGLTFVTIGFHDNFEDSKWLFVGIGTGLMMLSILGLIVLKGRLFMSMISRLFVGSLFIVSGLIKANDPLGFSYKLEEYFEDGALAFRIKEWFGVPGFTLEFLIDWALFLSVLICIVEIVLGVLVLIGGKIKLVSWLLILMMVFFTFLTWHTANCDPDKKFTDRDTYQMNTTLADIKIQEAKTNPDIKIISKSSSELVVDEMKQPQCVTDCGCFGDAMKGSVGRSLTPKESLWKDIVLVYLIIWIFVAQWKITPNTKAENLYVVPVSLALILFFSYVFGWYFPLLFGFVAILGALWVLRSGGLLFANYLGASIFVTAISFFLTSYVLLFEPIKDYRPYSVGSNLKEKMSDGIEGKYANLLVYKNLKTGEQIEYDAASKEYIDSKIWEKTDEWKYENIVTKELIPTKLPSITGQFNPVILFNDIIKADENLPYIKTMLSSALIPGIVLFDVENQSFVRVPENEYNLNDYDTSFFKFKEKAQIVNPELNEISIRDYLTTEKQIIILFSKNLKEANFSKIEAYKSIFKVAQKENIPMILVCSSNREEINKWREKYQFEIPAFINDETELKAIARSNPSLMILQNGTVRGKFAHRSLPTYQWLKKHILIK
jgi:uncharacterized membrane protein YphA (DoxX/SURF4 family)